MTISRNIASIYNPDLLTKAQLIDSFVIRVKKFEKLFADIKTATMEKPEQHLMLVGLRGMGKTTLLRRLAYEVENDPALHNWLMPVIFNEEEYGITQLFKLWEAIAEYMEKHDPVFAGLYDRMDAEYRRLKNDHHQYEQRAFELLVEALHDQHKKLLLFIDNFGDMFKRFKKPEKQRLREILMTCPDLRIIAASAVVIEAFFKYDDPLFEFFKTERLDALNSEETKTLLLKLGENLPDNRVQTIIEQQPERVEALRRLTGGIPRSMVLFFEIFATDKDGTAFTDLESILDRVTPLYKHRMDDLPTQQQEIMNVLALNYDGMSSREIADRTRLESKLVSAQLKQLQKYNLISIANPGSKNQIYHVYDRFFNIWFLMRMARKGDKNRVLWLVRFLECWCTPDQLSKRSETHRKALMQKDYDPKAALSFTNALYYAAQEDIETRYQLAKQTQNYLKDRAPDLYQQNESADIAFFGRGIAEMRRRDWEAAYRELSAIKDKNAQDYLLLYVLEERKGASEQATYCLQEARRADKNLCAERLIGEIYWNYLKDDLVAERYFLIAINHGDAKACRRFGNLLRDKRKDYEEAERYYRISIERGETYAWVNLGDLFGDTLKDYPQAEICYLEAIEKGHNIGWRYLGFLYADNLKNYEKAKEYYQKAIEAGETYAWINLGNLYLDNLTDYPQAETCYQKGVDAGHGEGWRYLGNLYADSIKNINKAEDFFHHAIAEDIQNANNSLAWAYFTYKIKDIEALAAAEKAYHEIPENYVAHTLSCIYLWNDRFEEAHKTAENFLFDIDYVDRNRDEKEFFKYFLLLLAKSQYPFLYDYFTGERGEAIRAKDRFLPVWYALMHYMKDEYPIEYLRTPPELKDTVQEIIDKAEEYRVAYQITPK